MTEQVEPIKIHRGLKDVYFERSATTFIDGKAGELAYRGYSIHDLARHSSFEETAYLLLHGELPKLAELAAFDEALKAARALPPAILDIIAARSARIPWTCCAPRSRRLPPSTPRFPTTPARPRSARASASPRRCR